MGRSNQQLKKCRACGDDLPVTLFYRVNKEALCFSCHNTYKRYRLNHYDITRMLNEQDHRCAICDDPISNKNLNVDHCHNNKRPRGLLCRSCNLGIGHFKDKITSLKQAIKYLKKYGQPHTKKS